jgi:hypothetical protein
MHDSMPCSDRSVPTLQARRWMSALTVVMLVFLLGLALPAQAHKASDAYLRLSAADGGGTSLRVDVALRDLDVAIDLDGDADGQLTWGEVKAAWPAIDDHLRRRVELVGCSYDRPEPMLERRSDGVYAAFQYRSACPLPDRPELRYTLLADIDTTHRGLLVIERSGVAAELRVLDPRVQARAAAATSTEQAGITSPSGDGAGGAGRFQFLLEGIAHLVGGYDHVLFLLVLLLPSVLRRTSTGWAPVERLGEAVWPVVGIVTAFTVAHSVTLTLAALGWVMLPPAFIEAAIAATIALAAVDNLWPIFGGRRVLVTFVFGLIHGFGFANVLAELDLPPLGFAWALFQFNLGLEIGQIGIVLVAVTLLFLARRRDLYRPVVIAGGSCMAIAVAAVWFIERTASVSLIPL